MILPIKRQMQGLQHKTKPNSTPLIRDRIAQKDIYQPNKIASKCIHVYRLKGEANLCARSRFQHLHPAINRSSKQSKTNNAKDVNVIIIKFDLLAKHRIHIQPQKEQYSPQVHTEYF